MIIGNILSELCVPSSFGKNTIALAFIQHAPITVTFPVLRLQMEKNYLGLLRNQMEREPKRLLAKFFRSFITEHS